MFLRYRFKMKTQQEEKEKENFLDFLSQTNIINIKLL